MIFIRVDISFVKFDGLFGMVVEVVRVGVEVWEVFVVFIFFDFIEVGRDILDERMNEDVEGVGIFFERVST